MEDDTGDVRVEDGQVNSRSRADALPVEDYPSRRNSVTGNEAFLEGRLRIRKLIFLRRFSGALTKARVVVGKDVAVGGLCELTKGLEKGIRK